LGAAKDQECLDLTDNNIAQLNNFPVSPRLQTLLCAQNRITLIADNVPKSLPNLHTLVLTQNNITELADLDVLKSFAKLTYVTLIGNPVASKEVSHGHLYIGEDSV
jgi:U2 small nuclear ribonucleoprotein A'